jgi:DNA-binding response OmpR family regulator
MSKGRILVVDDDFDISNMLRIYFSGQGYSVDVAPQRRGCVGANQEGIAQSDCARHQFA